MCRTKALIVIAHKQANAVHRILKEIPCHELGAEDRRRGDKARPGQSW
jgi:hypothetical protein